MPQAIDVFDDTQWSDEEKRYYAIVDSACDASKDMLIGNGNAKHAVFLMERFLRKSADRIVRLYSGSLVREVTYEGRPVDVYANRRLIEAATTFVKRPDTELRIMLENDIDGGDPEKHPLISAVLRVAPAGGRLQLVKISPEWRQRLKRQGFTMHWMTVDEKGFRLERDVDEHTALANFSSPKHARRLVNLFDRASLGTTPLLA